METLTEISLIQAVRKRPAMYTGSTSVRGFNNLLKGLINIAFYTTKTNYFSFELTGGLTGKIVLKNIQTAIPANVGQVFWIKGAKFALGFELAALNALSKRFDFEAFDEEGTRLISQTFEKGELKQGEINNHEYELQRIEAAFDLDDSIFTILEPLNANFYFDEIKELAYLYKGKTLAVIYSVAGEVCKTVFKFENGLKDKIEVEKLKGLGGTYFDTYLEQQFEDFSVEIAFAFREYSVDEPFFVSYVNEHRTHENGTHADGLLQGLVRGINRYFEKYNLAQTHEVTEAELKKSLIAAIHVKMAQPRFGGSVKNKLESPQIIEPLANHISDSLFDKLEKNSDSAQQLLHRFNLDYLSFMRSTRT